MMDKEYIDRETAKEAIFEYICGHTMSKFLSRELLDASKEGAEGAMNELDYVPVADVAPVVHGEWVMKETLVRSPFAKNAYCSECFEETGYCYNYCPNCGAKMDGGGHGN